MKYICTHTIMANHTWTTVCTDMHVGTYHQTKMPISIEMPVPMTKHQIQSRSFMQHQLPCEERGCLCRVCAWCMCSVSVHMWHVCERTVDKVCMHAYAYAYVSCACVVHMHP